MFKWKANKNDKGFSFDITKYINNMFHKDGSIESVNCFHFYNNNGQLTKIHNVAEYIYWYEVDSLDGYSK